MLAITGASGKLGRLISQALLARAELQLLRLGSRTPESLVAFARRGAQTAAADFDDPKGLMEFFAGVRVALIISGDAPNEKRTAQHRAAFAAAKRAGVERIVYTSFANPRHDSLFSVAASHADSEAVLQSLGVPFTILRNNLYAENILVEAARHQGELAQPGAMGKVAYITCADVADAAASVMIGETHANNIYEITGQRAVDQFEIAAELSTALGRTIRVVEISANEYRRTLLARGLPPFVAELITSLRLAVAANEYAHVSRDAAALISRPLESLSEFLEREAARASAIAPI